MPSAAKSTVEGAERIEGRNKTLHFIILAATKDYHNIDLSPESQTGREVWDLLATVFTASSALLMFFFSSRAAVLIRLK